MTKDTKTLRTFGLVMGSAFLALGSFFYLTTGEGVVDKVLLSVAIVFAIITLAVPIALAPIEYVWMKAAHILGQVMTMCILAVLFFFVITPMALVARFSRKRFLDTTRQEPANSYWQYRTEDESKHRKYEVQF